MRIPLVPLAAAGLALTLSLTTQSVAQYHPYASSVRPYRPGGTVYEPARPLSSYTSHQPFDPVAPPPPAPGDLEVGTPPVEMTPGPGGWTSPGGPCPQHFAAPCACDCFCGGWFGGFEFAWLRPRFSENVAMVIDPPPDDNILVPFNYDFETTPRVWLGYMNDNGFGVQARYWQFDGSADRRTFAPTADAPLAYIDIPLPGSIASRSAWAGIGETLTVSHNLDLHVFDLEAIQRWQWRRTILLGSLGVRYVRMDQEFRAVALDGAGVVDELVDHHHSFEGFGPVAGLEVIRPLGWSGFGVYGRVRGSILFGDRDQRIVEIKNAGADVARDRRSGDELLAIGELGLGLQYARPLRHGAMGFLRFGYEAQMWWDAGGPISTDANMGLEGFALAFGVYR